MHVIDIANMLEKLALYESGEITASDLQTNWDWGCKCRSHEVIGAKTRLVTMNETLENSYKMYHERRPHIFDPLASYMDKLNCGSKKDEVANEDDACFRKFHKKMQ